MERMQIIRFLIGKIVHKQLDVSHGTHFSGRSQALALNEFLAALTIALVGEGLVPCVLRNYEGFPSTNVGSDIDFLISRSDLPRAMLALRSIKGIQVVNYCWHPHVASVFVEGVSATPEERSIQIDFFLSLSWKGLSYLPVDTVLLDSQPRQAGEVDFFVPAPYHEAIISLMNSLIVGGWIKEKYFLQVRRTFVSDKPKVIAALLPQFGLKAATRLVESVIADDRQKVLGCLKEIRVHLLMRSLMRQPARSLYSIVRHYFGEGEVRYSPRTIDTVCILGASGCGKTTVIQNLISMLQHSTKIVERHHFRPLLGVTCESDGKLLNKNSCTKTLSGSVFSMAKLVVWLSMGWLSFFKRENNLTLRIFERYYHDLLIDPKRYRYDGPMWFARFVGKFYPSPCLWILLDPAVELVQMENCDLSPTEIAWQLEEYRSFVRTRDQYVILNMSKPQTIVLEEAYAAIIDTLTERTDTSLKNLF
jgi:energy-coupling factor transporter ATP-binding protein EcfA2